jgi:hypothetical protein
VRLRKRSVEAVGDLAEEVDASTVEVGGHPLDSPPTEPVQDEEVRASVRANWRSFGTVALQGERLSFPMMPPIPGIYRFSLLAAAGVMTAYVGETDNLNRRMGGYRNPGPSQATNQRINACLMDTLKKGGSVTVHAITSAQVDDRPLDLVSKPSRRLVENVILVELGAKGRAVENL